MATVVVSGYYGFGNAGDELILSALRRTLAGHRVVVLSADPAATIREHGVQAVPRMDLLGVFRALRGADLLVSGGGGLLQDATGPASVPYYLGIIAMARALGRPVMVYAQGIGPLRSGWARHSLRLLCSAAAVTVRDVESAEILHRAGVARAEVTADAVLSLPRPEVGPVPEELAHAGLKDGESVLAIAPRPYGGADFSRRLADAADRLAKRLPARVVLVPMQPREDTPACEAVAAAMRSPALLLREVPPLRYPELFAHFDLVVGMRLHALILAALCRTPAVGLSYDPKIEAFMQSLGLSTSVLGLDAPAEVIATRSAEGVPPGPEAAAALESGLARLRETACLNDRRLLDLVASVAPDVKPLTL